MTEHKYLFAFAAWASALLLAPALPANAASGPEAAFAAAEVSATEPGALLSAQPEQPADALAHAGRRFLITYRSRGPRGQPVVVSGYVLTPKGQPPQGGWPVLAWAHGTTGVADICAPSGFYPGGPEYDYHELVMQALDPWLARGYVVVATDYEGLGTPGGHPYMDAASQLHAVVDSVRAAHRLLPGQLSADWLVMGHSQGGAAALEVAAHGQADAPKLRLRGAIAAAPGGYDYAGIAEYALAHPRLDPGVAAFFPIVLLGAAAAEPAIHPDQLVSPDMEKLLNAARSHCLDGLRQIVTKPPEGVFKKGADLKPLLDHLARQSIERMSPTVPVLLIQGTDDKLVSVQGTRAYERQLCKAGKTVFLHLVPGGSHRDALRQSAKFSAGFLAWLYGDKSMPSCAPASE